MFLHAESYTPKLRAPDADLSPLAGGCWKFCKRNHEPSIKICVQILTCVGVAAAVSALGTLTGAGNAIETRSN